MSSQSVPWFKFYPADFMNGVRGLTATEVGLYQMLLCRIYEESGPVEFHPLRLATYCGMRETTFKKTVERLVDLGKLTVVDGMLMNARAADEISKRARDLKNSSKAGKASAEKRQQNQRKEATDVQRTFNHKDTDSEEEERDSSYELLSPDADATDDAAKAIDAYNLAASESGWPKVQVRTKARVAAVKARMKEAGGLSGWLMAIEKAQASSHCCGKNQRGWTADFDFISRQSSFAKIMEGNYDDRAGYSKADTDADALRGAIVAAGSARKAPEPDFL